MRKFSFCDSQYEKESKRESSGSLLEILAVFSAISANEKDESVIPRISVRIHDS